MEGNPLKILGDGEQNRRQPGLNFRFCVFGRGFDVRGRGLNFRFVVSGEKSGTNFKKKSKNVFFGIKVGNPGGDMEGNPVKIRAQIEKCKVNRNLHGTKR